MQHFEWKKVVIVHSSDEEGRAMLGKLQNRAEDKGVQVILTYLFQGSPFNTTGGGGALRKIGRGLICPISKKRGDNFLFKPMGVFIKHLMNKTVEF